jgi:Flp pilus assembly protein TadG
MPSRFTLNTFRSESGQAAIEFALVLPLLLVVLVGVIDFGFAFNYWNDEQHLASTGARYAAVGRSPSGTLQSYIRSQAENTALRNGGTRQIPNPLKVCVFFPNGRVAGQPVRVEVSTSYAWMPILGGAPNTTIGGRATMRLETAPDAAVVPEGCA